MIFSRDNESDSKLYYNMFVPITSKKSTQQLIVYDCIHIFIIYRHIIL